MSATGRRAVAIGGGTGLPIVLRCLVELGFKTSAVVTMADDGGSSGLLRRELGMLPPGDVRNCLVALADADSTMGRLFQYRFAHGEGLAGHALGNLVIAALAEITGGFPEAIEGAGRLLGVRGDVFPSTLVDVSLHATDARGQSISGQARIAHSVGPVTHVRLVPPDPEPYGPAVEAIREADVVVLGPGSLFTSLVPNLLVPGIASALRESKARRVYICNVANQRGETSGMDAAAHVRALLGHGLDDALDLVIVHRPAPDPARRDHSTLPEDRSVTVDVVSATPEVVAEIESLGLDTLVADVVDPADPRHHSFARVHEVLERLVT